MFDQSTGRTETSPYNIKRKNMNEYTQKNKIRGSLVGGAIGDAMGYPVEFISSYQGIQKRYGEQGIIRLDTTQWWLADSGNSNKAWISDDTQMTLFTACGLLNSEDPFRYKYAICEAYLEWFLTQSGRHKQGYKQCWIKSLPELNVRRAPGNTCLTALQAVFSGREPFNNSKGCGGIMRTAPIALYGAIDNRLSIEDAMTLAADAAEITHQHPLGWLPSALEAFILYRILLKEDTTIDDFESYLAEGYEKLEELYPNEIEGIKELKGLTEKALSLVNSPFSDVDNIETIGEGWVAEETFAIAIYCTARYFDNFEQAMIASVNHRGDSDSTGAVAGNILGAVIGYDAIPQFFKDDLELRDVILHVADDLWRGETTQFKL